MKRYFLRMKNQISIFSHLSAISPRIVVIDCFGSFQEHPDRHKSCKNETFK